MVGIIAIIYTNFLNTKIIHETNYIHSEINDITQKNENLKLYLKQLVYESINSNNLTINQSVQKNVVNKLGDKPILFFRFSALNCQSCIKHCENQLWSFYSSEKDTKNICYIVSDFMDQSNEISYPNTINIDKNSLSIPAEEINFPYFFILNKGTIEHIFIPDLNNTELTTIYFKEIKKRYFDITS